MIILINLFVVQKLNVKFSDLNPAEDTKKLFDYVYKNDNYQINAENIEAMILEYSSEIEVNDLRKAHYNSILNSNCEDLISYLKGDINSYVKKVFLKLEDNTEEPKSHLFYQMILFKQKFKIGSNV
jgi:hypothetical protein